jgi:hypothetical protein
MVLVIRSLIFFKIRLVAINHAKKGMMEAPIVVPYKIRNGLSSVKKYGHG